MKAMILAAGYGRRMGDATVRSHKLLLDINGRSIGQRLVESLLAVGIEDVIVVTGHNQEQVADHLVSTCPGATFSFVHNEQYRSTNNLVSLSLGLEALEPASPLLLLECDLVVDPEIIARAAASDGDNFAVVSAWRPGMDGTVVEVGDEGRIDAVVLPHMQGPTYRRSDKFKTLNIYGLTAESCESQLKPWLRFYREKIDVNSYYEVILGLLTYLGEERLQALDVSGCRWAEIDDPNDLERATFIFGDGSVRRQMLEARHGGYWNFPVMDFAYIRNQYFPSASMWSELREALPSYLENYGSAQAIIDRKMRLIEGIDSGELVGVNGAAQLFPILSSQWDGKCVAVPVPTFGEYTRHFPNAETYCDAPGVDPVELESVLARVDVCVVVNPNNPTGTTLPSEWLIELAEEHPTCTIVADESFVDFADTTSIVHQLGESEGRSVPNIVVLKSLSKAYGVPGMRLGWLWSQDQEYVAAVRSRLPVWNLNSVAEGFLELCAKYRREFAASIEETVAQREEFKRCLERSEAVREVWPSGGNFVLAELSCAGAELSGVIEQALSGDEAVYLKDVSSKMPGGRPMVRLAVRTAEENRFCVGVIEDAIASLRTSRGAGR